MNPQTTKHTTISPEGRYANSIMAYRIREFKNDWSRFCLAGAGLGRSIYALLRIHRRCRGVKVIVWNGDVFQLRREMALGVVPLSMLLEVLSTVQQDA